MRPETSVSDLARYALGAVRLVNGGLCLLAPARATRQMGVEPEANPAALYVLRLFGIRTVMIGAEVFVLRGEELARSLRLGLLIHACDGVSAVAAGASGHLPTRTAARAAAISALNVTLSAVALRAAPWLIRHQADIKRLQDRAPAAEALSRRGRADRKDPRCA